MTQQFSNVSPNGTAQSAPTVQEQQPGQGGNCKGKVSFLGVDIPPPPGMKWCNEPLGYFPSPEALPCPGGSTEVPCSGSNALNNPVNRGLQTPGSGAPLVSGLPGGASIPDPTKALDSLGAFSQAAGNALDWFQQPAHWKGLGLLAAAFVVGVIGLFLWLGGGDAVQKVGRV